MSKAFKAGASYFALVFALGFLLGTIRVLFLSPRLGDSAAVLAEISLILTASWFVCRFLVRRFAVDKAFMARLVMGASAFTLLMAAELLLGIYAFDRSLSAHIGHYATTPGLLGLTGQIVFALFPLVDLAVNRNR